MMMDAQGSRYFHFESEQHATSVAKSAERSEFPSTVHLKFEDGVINAKEALEIAKMFESYGDFFLHKDTPTSVYLEFFFIDPNAVPSQTLTDVIANLKARNDLSIVDAFNHGKAPKFKAHDNFEAR